MSKIWKFLAAAVLVAFVASPASATIIFQDNFNRANSNTVGNGWTELEADANDVAIVNNQLQLRDYLPGNPDAAASQLGGLSSIGLDNITFTYDWGALTSSDPSDDLFIDWKLASSGTWINLAAHGLGGNGSLTSNTVSLGVAAANASNLQFRIWTDVNRHNEGAVIDNVKLAGDYNYNPIAVSEPSSVAIMGIGLLGLGYLGRRRRRRA